MCLIFEQFLTISPKINPVFTRKATFRSPEFASSAIWNVYSSAREFRKFLAKIMYYYYNLK